MLLNLYTLKCLELIWEGGMKLEIRRRIVLSLLPWLQLLKAGPQEDVVLLLGVVELVALAPIIGHSVGKDLPVLVECRLGDGLLTRLARLQLGASVLVPEGEAAVGADGGEGAVHWVEGDVVHGKDILIEKGRVNKNVAKSVSLLGTRSQLPCSGGT